MNQDSFGWDEDFQQLILASALKDPGFLLQYEDVLLPGYFDYEWMISVMRITRELTEKFGSVPSKPTIVEEIKAYCSKFNVDQSNQEYILNSVDKLYKIEVLDVDYVQSRVVQFGRRQAFRGAILKIVKLMDDKQASHEENHNKMVEILENALRVGEDTRDLGFSLYPNLDKIPELVKDTAMGAGRKVPTGFPTVDKATDGGPGRGEVWTVIGFPGRGKSTFLINLGAHALKSGLPVAHITVGDLKQVDVGVRYAARLTQTTQHDVRKGTPEYMRKVKTMMKYDPHLFIKYFPSDTATMGHVKSWLSKLKAVHGVSPALTILDYPEELKQSVKNDTYLSSGAHYSAMNRMASEFDTLFWAASQPKNVKLEGNLDVLRGSNMAESWKKFQKVDGACSWNMTEEEELFKRGRLWFDKTRRYKSFYTVHCDTDLDRMTIKEGKPPAEGTAERHIHAGEYSGD